MKFTLVIVAVLVTLVASAKVPQMSEVSVDVDETPVVAHVVEVAKDHVHNPDQNHIQVVAKVPVPLVNKGDVVVDDMGMGKDKVVVTPVEVDVPVVNAVHSVVMPTVTTVPDVVTVPEAVVPVSMKPKMMGEDPCDLLCTKFELNPVCAWNGNCLHEFANECVMNTYNCKHSEVFAATMDDKCQMHWLQHCTEKDLMH